MTQTVVGIFIKLNSIGHQNGYQNMVYHAKRLLHRSGPFTAEHIVKSPYKIISNNSFPVLEVNPFTMCSFIELLLPIES